MNALRSLRSLRLTVAVFTGLALLPVAGSAEKNKETKITVPVVSDWTHNHLIFPQSKDNAVMARVKSDKHWKDSYYARHAEAWWPQYHPRFRRNQDSANRDWNINLGTTTFEPTYDFNFAIGTQDGIWKH